MIVKQRLMNVIKVLLPEMILISSVLAWGNSLALGQKSLCPLLLSAIQILWGGGLNLKGNKWLGNLIS